MPESCVGYSVRVLPINIISVVASTEDFSIEFIKLDVQERSDVAWFYTRQIWKLKWQGTPEKFVMRMTGVLEKTGELWKNMSYIHGPCDTYYTPSESLKNLFEELIVQPFEHDLPALSEDVKNNRIYYWEDIARILKQGQSDFDEVSFDKPSNEYYFPKDKVSIYCVHHMPRHLFGSYHIYTKYLTPISEKNKVVFIDFGCGPLTSGIAFRAFAGQNDITYLGIDSSRTMLDKAATINRYGTNKYKDPFFDKFALIGDYSYNDLTKLLDKYIGNGDRTQIIFNFCYFFSSPTLDINNLSDVLIRIMKAHNQQKMCLIYQNPDHRSLSGARRLKLYGKWEKLKTNLSVFRSQVPQSNLETFSYCRLINGLLHNSNVYYEMLCYE